MDLAKSRLSGMLDAGATPREIDPARGWIATANQRIHPSDYPHYIGSEWAPPWRYQRIAQMLTAKDKLSLDDMRTMQADTLSLAALRLLPLLKQAAPEHPLAAAIVRGAKDQGIAIEAVKDFRSVTAGGVTTDSDTTGPGMSRRSFSGQLGSRSSVCTVTVAS